MFRHLDGMQFLREKTGLDLPQPEMSTTGASVATGAALGAGVGAIVGSSTGSAGEGLVIGTMAGAMAGGLIGNQLENQEKSLDTQKESLTRQQEVISGQDREIQQLRESLSDRFPNNVPSRASRNFSPDKYKGNPQAKRLVGGSSFSEEVVATRASIPASARSRLASPIASREAAPVRSRQAKPFAVATQERSPKKTEKSIAPVATRSVERAIATTPVALKSEPVRAAETNGLPPARSTSALEQQGTMPTAPTTVARNEPSLPEPAKAIEPAPTPVAAVEKTAEKIQSASAPSVFSSAKVSTSKPASPACSEGEQERERAKHATSEADKIFYMKRAIRLCPQNADYRTEIGKLYAGIGLNEEAKSEFMQAIDLDPENELAQQQLGQLEKTTEGSQQ